MLALLTLSPILLNVSKMRMGSWDGTLTQQWIMRHGATQPAYAALTVWTRELVFLEMWAGQMLCEATNYVLKHIIREDRPNGESRLLACYALLPFSRPHATPMHRRPG